MKRSIVLVLLLVAVGARAQSPIDYPSIWQCDAVKPHWYCDEQLRDDPPPEVAAPAPRRELASLATAQQMREELKRREDLAVMVPSEANIKDYLALWQAVQEKGAVFADVWRRVVWQTPELDYALKRPINNAAIRVFDAERDQAETQQLRAVAGEHGLIFFFRSDCPYCHAMAPVLRMLNQKYGIEVLGVSLDGGDLPEFPVPRDGRKIAASWGVDRVPALFIGARATGDHAALGFGAMSLSEIVNRIFILTGTRPGENF